MSNQQNRPSGWQGLYLSFLNLLIKIGLGFLLGDKAAKYSARFRYKATGWIADKTLKTNSCPWCGGALKECVSQYGKFIGCSNFPNCKYKRNA